MLFSKTTAIGGWRLVEIASWRLAVGGWRRLTVGGWSRLAAVGGWRLAVGGSWRLAVGGPLGRSLRAVLNQKKIWSLMDHPGLKGGRGGEGGSEGVGGLAGTPPPPRVPLWSPGGASRGGAGGLLLLRCTAVLIHHWWSLPRPAPAVRQASTAGPNGQERAAPFARGAGGEGAGLRAAKLGVLRDAGIGWAVRALLGRAIPNGPGLAPAERTKRTDQRSSEGRSCRCRGARELWVVPLRFADRAVCLEDVRAEDGTTAPRPPRSAWPTCVPAAPVRRGTPPPPLPYMCIPCPLPPPVPRPPHPHTTPFSTRTVHVNAGGGDCRRGHSPFMCAPHPPNCAAAVDARRSRRCRSQKRRLGGGRIRNAEAGPRICGLNFDKPLARRSSNDCDANPRSPASHRQNVTHKDFTVPP